jgi:hypothetical protein
MTSRSRALRQNQGELIFRWPESLRAIGVVVNPKLAVPCLVLIDHEGDDVHLVSMAEPHGTLGRGFYDDCEPSDRNEASQACLMTGYPRVHVAIGVRGDLRKDAYGTALYTALCVGAHLGYTHKVALVNNPSVRADGISSNSALRTADADLWWERSREKFGLTATVEKHGRVADVYPYASAVGAGLVGAAFVVNVGGALKFDEEYDVVTELKGMDVKWPHYDEDAQPVWQLLGATELLDVYVEPLLACSVGALSLDGINLLGHLCVLGGVGDRALGELRARWLVGADPERPRSPRMQAKFGKELRFNEADARLASDGVERAERLREQLGWGKFSEDG